MLKVLDVAAHDLERRPAHRRDEPRGAPQAGQPPEPGELGSQHPGRAALGEAHKPVPPGRIFRPKGEFTGSKLGAFNVRGAHLVRDDFIERHIEANALTAAVVSG